MPYPPTVPVSSRTDATGLTTNHPADHNAISLALTDIVNELGADPSGVAATLTARLDSFGAYTAFVPQIDQGATTNIAKTVTYSRFTRVNRKITWNFQLGITGSGTAGFAVALALPVESVASSVVGAGGISDNSVQMYAGIWTSNTSTSVTFRAADQTNTWGITPSAALANFDILFGSITFEALT